MQETTLDPEIQEKLSPNTFPQSFHLNVNITINCVKMFAKFMNVFMYELCKMCTTFLGMHNMQCICSLKGKVCVHVP